MTTVHGQWLRLLLAPTPAPAPTLMPTPTAASPPTPTPSACPVDALDLADRHVAVVAAAGAANVTLTVNYEYLRNFLIKIANVPR